MRCACCGEKYDDDEIREMRMMGEEFWKDWKSFICPDCWDDLQQMDPEEIVESFTN